MILLYLILLLMLGGVVSWLAGNKNEVAGKWIAFLSVLTGLGVMVSLWIKNPVSLRDSGPWLIDYQVDWIPSLGASFHLAMDGLSMVMVVLTLFIGALGVLVSFNEIKTKVGFYYFNLLWLLAGIVGVFLAVDLLLFYFFWEIMLIPMFFILGIWGYEKRKPAAIKFFIFTQLSGLLMLLAILGLYFIHGKNTGVYTFDYFELLGSSIPSGIGFWLMCGFLIAFLVKLPAVPFHSWLPDAYVQSPTAGTVILAGLMTKTAAYGMLRFVLPLFPEASAQIANTMMILGVAGILYGAKVAYAQTDFKRLIAFSSIAHMGFIVIGVFAFNSLAYQGTIIEMLAHGISISALFIIAGAIRERTGLREMDQMGRFWEKMPRMGGFTIVFVMASLGLPGLANFIAEFMILAGVFKVSTLWATLATLGLISSMIYSLVILQKIFYGTSNNDQKLEDFSTREYVVMASLTVAIVWLGFFPQKVVNTVEPSVEMIEEYMNIDANGDTEGNDVGVIMLKNDKGILKHDK